MIKDLLDEMRAQTKESQLIKYMAPAILLLFSLYAVDAIWGSSHSAAEEYEALLLREQKIASLHEQADWDGVSEVAKEQASLLSARIWSAESLELASADLQNQLRSLSDERITAVRINLSPPVQLPLENVWRLSAEVTGKFVPSKVPGLLLEIAEQKPSLIVDRFSYAPSRNQAGLIQVSAIFDLSESPVEAEE